MQGLFRRLQIRSSQETGTLEVRPARRDKILVSGPYRLRKVAIRTHRHYFDQASLYARGEPRIARNKRILLAYPHLSAILSEATVFCVTGGYRG